MTWSASDMLASTGARMPWWYHEDARADYEALVNDVVALENDWIQRLPESNPYLELTDYEGPDDYWVTLKVNGFSVRFRTIIDVEMYLERTYT